MTYLLDTDICVEFLRGRFGIKEKIEKVGIDNCFLSEISIAELIFGAYNSKNFTKHIEEVKQLQQLFEIIPIKSAFDIYGQERAFLKNKGELIPDFDLLIGCTSVASAMKMVTNNEKHLSRISNISIENWINDSKTQTL
jgi:tRNA(fMet)-specific endonuclease VapC